MQTRFGPLFAIAWALAIPGVALGQDATATDAPAPDAAPETTAPEPAADVPAAEAAPETEAAAEPTSPGEPANPGEAALPDDVTRTAFGDWEVRCTADRSNCFMYQLVRDEQLNPVAEITIVTLPEGSQAAAGATVVSPLGTLLTEGLIMQVDSGAARKYEFGWCTRSGCFARFGLTTEELNNLKRGNQARIRISSVSAPERPVLLNVSLSGFTAGFADLSK